MADNLLTLMDPVGSSSGIGFSAVFFVISFIILAVTCIHMFYKSQESFKLGIQIPGPEPVPIFGNALMALRRTPNGKQTNFECCCARLKN